MSTTSAPVMRTTALLPPPVVATMVRASRPGLNRLLSTASKVPAGTRTRQVRQTIRTLDYPARSEQVRGEWVIGGRSGVGHVRTDQPIIYYLHGSGYVVCSTRTHRGLTARLSNRTGRAVFSLDYRLAPRHRWPAAGDDTIRGYLWLLDQGFAPEQIVVAGDSAGGHLALDLLGHNQRTGTPQPGGVALLSPLYDPTFALARAYQRTGNARDPFIEATSGRKFLRLYTGNAAADHPRMRVVLAPGDTLPPTLIQHGGIEVMTADARAAHDMLAAAGADVTLQSWPGQGHVFQMFGGRAAREALDELTAFIGPRT